MIPTARALMVVAVAGVFLAGNPGHAQPPAPPPPGAAAVAPPGPPDYVPPPGQGVVPLVPPAGAPGVPGVPGVPSVPPVNLTGPPHVPPYPSLEDRNGPLLIGDPLLDRCDFPAPGWFAGVDIGIVVPHIKNRLSAPVHFPGGITEQVRLPGAELDWTGSPRFEVGYRLPQGAGSFLVSYRSLVSEGTESGIDTVGNMGFLKTRLNANVIDLDYENWEYSLLPKWDMRWRVGARIASIYFDNRLLARLAPLDLDGTSVFARSSNNFFGAGPHASLQLTRRLSLPGLAVFGGIEGAVVVGRIHQNFEEVFDFNQLGGQAVGAASGQSDVQAVPVLSFELGLRYTPPRLDQMRFSIGYQYEYWWMLGRLNDSRADLGDQGFFFRSEFHF